MIINILSISVMSDKAERVFSETHCTVSWEKIQMNAETLECVKYLKHWKQNEILNEWLNKK